MIHTDAGYYTPVTPPGGAGATSYMHVWYLKDHLGNNRVLADGGGNALKMYHYDPFGEQISVASSASLSPFPSGAAESPYRYGGKEWSAPTSTYDFEARQFSPSFHRFTSMDPLAEKYYGISPYAYCKDNPVNLVDPNGLIDKEWLKKGGTTLGAGLVATIGGGLAVLSEAGVAPGAYALSTGISAIGLGVGMIIIGLSTDPTPEGRQKLEMMPTGVANAIGKSSDQVLGTKNHEVEMIANFIDATIGLGTLAEPQTPIESVVNLITIVQAGAATKKVGEMLMEEQSSSRGIENNDLPIIHKNWKQDLEESSPWKSSEYQL